MSEFEFPTNIKQIGSIGGGMRIYIEDYACSYLQQYAEAGGFEERLAFLVGRRMVIDTQTVLFVSGLVQGTHTVVDKETLCFTEKSWQHARDEIKRYFKGLDIVGWMQSQPGYGVYLNEHYANLHKKLFPREDQVLFVIDPAEKLNAFYIYDDSKENLAESQGYFIYYDKNRGMHEYMLDNKIVKTKRRPMPAEGEPAPAEGKSKAVTTAAARLRALAGEREGARKSAYSQRRVVNLLVSLSAALFIVCFIMGAGLIQNDGRITSMESQMTQLNTAYRDLLVQIRDGSMSSVFADQGGAEGAEPEAIFAEEAAGEGTPAGQAVVINEDGNRLLDENALVTEVSATDPQQALTPLETYSPPGPGGLLASVEPEDAAEEAAPEGVSEAAPTAGNEDAGVPETYTVQQGDNLSYISIKFYGDKSRVEDIMTLNGMDDADTIFFGKVLQLPR